MNKENCSEEKLNVIRKEVFSCSYNNCYSSIKNYFEIFDKPSKRYSNYADEILFNIKNLNNVSQTWKSGLNIDRMVDKIVNNKNSFHMSSPNTDFKVTNEIKQKVLQFNFHPIEVKTQDYKETTTLNKIEKVNQILTSDDETPKKLYSFKTFVNQKNNQNTGSLSFGSFEESKSKFELQNNDISASNFKDQKCGFNYKENFSNETKIYSNKIFETQNNEIKISDNNTCGFRTAKEQLGIDIRKQNSNNSPQVAALYGTNKKFLGTRRGVRSEFIAPVIGNKTDQTYNDHSPSSSAAAPIKMPKSNKYESIINHENLKQFEPAKVELLLNEILDFGKPIYWDDIAGLESPKQIIQEIVMLPMLRPDLFTGIRAPAKGLLLFGPPGTGKTLIGKCIASQSKSTFFSISASSLTSKWVGDGEKMVRIMFTVARLLQPAVIFIDEIDSLLSQRNETEHESSRKIKTQFLVEMEGVGTGENEKLLFIGATNRPYEIDEAVRRRFVKRVYIPLPSAKARRQIIYKLLKNESLNITEEEVESILEKSDGYSGADMTNLCKEAAMGPIRNLPPDQLVNLTLKELSPIKYQDFVEALENVKSSVSSADLDKYLEFNTKYGSSLKQNNF